MIKMLQHGVSLLNCIEKPTLWRKRTSAYGFVLAMSNVVHSSAVYRQQLCRDPARLRRGQEGNSIGDVLGFSDATHHCAGSKPLHRLLPVGGAAPALVQIGVH